MRRALNPDAGQTYSAILLLREAVGQSRGSRLNRVSRFTQLRPPILLDPMCTVRVRQLFNNLADKSGTKETFTIITTEPSKFAAQFHNRMPLVLEPRRVGSVAEGRS
jgi:hypothetical protein